MSDRDPEAEPGDARVQDSHTGPPREGESVRGSPADALPATSAPPGHPLTSPGAHPPDSPGPSALPATSTPPGHPLTSPGAHPPDSSEPADSPEAAAPARPSRRKRLAAALWVVGFSLLAFATGLLLFNNLVMPRLIHGVGEVRVPDLANLTLEQAERTLRPLDLQLSRAGERFDPSVPRGFILSQDPPPDVPVRGRRRVMVVVSLGEEFSSVPALFGESVRNAQLLIDRAGLRAGATTKVPFEDVGAGLVVASDPPAESVLPRETAVSLLVSTGPGAEYYVMPDLVGREISGARHQLETFGLRVLTPPAAPSVGPVVSQQPAAGSRITRDVTIVLQATGRVLR